MELIEIAWKRRSDGRLRSSISFQVGGMVQASDILAFLGMTLKNLLTPEPNETEMNGDQEKDNTPCGHG